MSGDVHEVIVHHGCDIAGSGDLIRLRTKEGMQIAKAKGRLHGRPPKLNPRQTAHLLAVFEAGEHSPIELADLFCVGRSTVYRVIGRARAGSPTVPASATVD